MTRIFIKIFTLLFLLAILPCNETAIGQSKKQKQTEDNPFLANIFDYPSRTPGKTKGVLLLLISNNNLRFLKSGNSFVAEYEMSVEIFDVDGKSAGKKFWDETIVENSFFETINGNKNFTKKIDFDLDPGAYTFYAQMRDKSSDIVFERSGTKELEDYWSESVGLSDIVFTYSTEYDTSFTMAVPPNKLIQADYHDGFSAQFQLFSADDREVAFSYKIYSYIDNRVEILGDSLTLEPANQIVDIDVPFTGGGFQPGVYLIRTNIRHLNGATRTRMQKFTCSWLNRPLESYDITKSFEQMEYILSGEDQDELKELKTEEEKFIYFKEYWKARDISPETEQFELMVEYFTRIETANQVYKAGDTPGWKTDRGRVYTIYGTPDTKRILKTFDQRYPPQETWIYYHAKKKFIFIDRSRKGHFLLVSETRYNG